MKRLRMASKLALAIVPIGLVALAAGGLVAWNALERAADEERASIAAEVAADAMDSLVAFSTEQAMLLDTAVGNAEGSLQPRQSATDNALTRLSDSVKDLIPKASGPASGIVASIAGDSSRLQPLIGQLRQTDPTSPESAELVSDIGHRLISIVTQSTFFLGDESRAREGEGAVALSQASFASLQEELLIVQNEFNELLDEETFTQQMLRLESSVEDWINAATAASPTVEANGLARTQTLSGDEGFTSETFPMDRNAIVAATASEILVRVSNSAEAAAAEARAQASTVGVVVIAALVVAAITALIVGRSTTKRVRSITAAAHHVTEVDLPRMIDSLSNPSGVLEATTPMDVDKTGQDEVGDLARSFSTLHTTLVDVANQQMETLRTGVSEIFVTMARRNRSLIDRQLALVDQLEAREEDPEVLDGYYQLDHLATRMRRNAESLLVLAGSESPRMWAEPVEMGEVVRAALGEVDEYKRIEVLAMEPSMLVGRAVSDLSHLLSELLDNATQFSPPTERVRVTGLFDDDGYVITIADSGVGMSTERTAELNHLIENPPVLGLALEPTLGMYVVARLGLRHGVKVRLVPGVPGTTVRVTIPRELLESGRAEHPVEPAVVDEIEDEPAETSPAPIAVAKGHQLEPMRKHTVGADASNGNGSSPRTAKEAEKSEIDSSPEGTVDSPNGDDYKSTTAAQPESEPAQPVAPLVTRPVPPAGTNTGANAPTGPGSEESAKAKAPSNGTRTTPVSNGAPQAIEGSAKEETSPAREGPTVSKPPTPTTPRHAATPPSKPGEAEAEKPSGSDPERPENGSLPTRRPGTSYRESNEFAVSSASSQADAAGIRSALDGFRQGRDIATGKNQDVGDDDITNESDGAT